MISLNFGLILHHPIQPNTKNNPEPKKNLSSQACVTLQLRIPGNFKSSCTVFLGLLVGLGETVQEVVGATTLATKLEKQKKTDIVLETPPPEIQRPQLFAF